jgi:hypothetical protein
VEVPSDGVFIYFEKERIQALEHIVRHYTGLEQYSRKSLETVIANFPSREGALVKADGEENEDSSSDGRDCASIDTASTGK